MEKLPIEFKSKWIAALRSGEYIQTKDVFYNKRTDSYCCLGVAAVLCDMSKDDIVNVGEPEDLPIEFEEMPVVPVFSNRKVFGQLIKMNDYEDKTFPEIADWIEENL